MSQGLAPCLFAHLRPVITSVLRLMPRPLLGKAPEYGNNRAYQRDMECCRSLWMGSSVTSFGTFGHRKITECKACYLLYLIYCSIMTVLAWFWGRSVFEVKEVSTRGPSNRTTAMQALPRHGKGNRASIVSQRTTRLPEWDAAWTHCRPTALPNGLVITHHGKRVQGPTGWMPFMARTSVSNVCFHGIGTPGRELEPDEDAYWIDAESFALILDEVATWRSARISFDDANESDVRIALPALLERGLSAQFFPVAARLGTQGSLSAEDVRELAACGMTIGTHGMFHRPWLGMTPEIREAELVTARLRLEEVVGAPVTEAACPLGRYDRRLIADLKRLGYQRVYTSDRALAQDDSWLQPRFSVRRGDTPQSLREVIFASASPARQVAHSVKRLVKRMR